MATSVKKKKYVRPPKDTIVSNHNFKLVFSTYDYPYDKGSDARFIISGKIEANDRLKYPGDNGSKITCEFQDWICGFNSKDMANLSEWAKKAAKYLKDQEQKTGYIHDHD
jgi:hypothetical protein